MAANVKCERCGQPVGFENHVVSSPYGGGYDEEPPEPEFLCLRCWDGNENKKLFWNTRFTKPTIVRDDFEYRYDPASNMEIVLDSRIKRRMAYWPQMSNMEIA